MKKKNTERERGSEWSEIKRKRQTDREREGSIVGLGGSCWRRKGGGGDVREKNQRRKVSEREVEDRDIAYKYIKKRRKYILSLALTDVHFDLFIPLFSSCHQRREREREGWWRKCE